MSDEQRPDDMLDPVETLIRAGGRRVEPPEEAYWTVLAAAESALRGKLERRRLWRIGSWLAVAATIGALAVGLSLSRWSATPSSPVEVARVDRLEGQAEWRGAGSRAWTPLAAPVSSLARGGTLRTEPHSGVGLLYPDGSSLRLGAGSEIELTDAWSVTLRQGTLYVATVTATAEPGRLEVVTRRGRVRHLGTQFEVKYEAPTLRVRVREGRLAIAAATGRVVAEAGEEVSIGATGDAARRMFARDDPAWHWVEMLAPMPLFDGRPAQALLEWAAREMGRDVVYASPAVEQRAASVVLHGDPGPLAPAVALDVMLATTDLAVDTAGGGRIRVHRK